MKYKVTLENLDFDRISFNVEANSDKELDQQIENLENQEIGYTTVSIEEWDEEEY